MKKSIPLKEIVGFLPYGLKVKTSLRTRELVLGQEFIDINNDTITVHEVISNSFHKPIVRPLSDLTKEITHNGETFVPLKYLHQEVFNCEWPEFEIDFQTLEIIVNSPEEFYISFQDIKLMLEKLHEWHFDIYDWIKDGLAVDINTI